MTTTYNVYCDESCHLEKDQQKIMVLGAIWCELEKTREITTRICEIKSRHDLSADFEYKWTKVSPSKLDFYLDLINYFFDDDDLHFRALVVPDKPKLKHDLFNQDHDTFYYKMIFDMLKVILDPHERYRIYLDIKDTRSAGKICRLRDILSDNMYDFRRDIIERVQTIHSYESDILQLTDLLIGGVSYINRELNSSSAKVAIVKRIQERSGYSLTKTNLLRESKFNIFIWQSSEQQQ